MKKSILIFAAALLLISCGNKESIIVWNGKDIIGMWIAGIFVSIYIIILIISSFKKRK